MPHEKHTAHRTEIIFYPWVSKCVRLSDALVGDLRGEDGYLESGEIATATPKIFPALLEALRWTRGR